MYRGLKPVLNGNLDRTIRSHKRSRTPYRYPTIRQSWCCPFCDTISSAFSVVRQHIVREHPPGTDTSDT